METKEIKQILKETSYVRLGGSENEKKCAQYLADRCADYGLKPVIDPFPITMYDIECERLTVNGKSIRCTGYRGSASKTVSGTLCFLESISAATVRKCKDRIVLLAKPLGYRFYDQLVKCGAKGFITFGGELYSNDKDIDVKEIGFTTDGLERIPGVHIHISDALRLSKSVSATAEIELKYNESYGQSRNVWVDLPGTVNETIVVSAHYDSTALSVGAFDNMSSCIAMLALVRHFADRPRRRGIRFLWCGSEERGLLGSLEYCNRYQGERSDAVLNVNLDMLGAMMGEFTAFSCINEEVVGFMNSFFKISNFPAAVRYGLRSSDSNSFVYYGIPAISFARFAPAGMPKIHSRYDTEEIVSAKNLAKDIQAITKITEYFVNEPKYSFSLAISDKIQKDVGEYMNRRARAIK